MASDSTDTSYLHLSSKPQVKGVISDGVVRFIFASTLETKIHVKSRFAGKSLNNEVLMTNGSLFNDTFRLSMGFVWRIHKKRHVFMVTKILHFEKGETTWHKRRAETHMTWTLLYPSTVWM